MTEIAITEVVLDKSIYPRTAGDEATVRRYAEAMGDGEVFPPIVLESGTNRLIDGWHRLHAAQRLERATIQADHHTIPDGTDARLYAASLSAKHGLPITDSDLQRLARELYEADPGIKLTEVAKLIGRARTTVQGWVQDLAEKKRAIEERQRVARQYAVLLLRAAGWNQSEIADALGVSQRTVSNDAESGTAANDLDEAALRAALDLIPTDARAEAEETAEAWREERIFATWADDERDLLKRLRNGETVVVNMREGGHANLWRWADAAELFERVDRKTIWGNPFITPDDGDRATVIANYADHYLPHKPSLLRQLHDLRGKALGCWCAPEACHADVLKARADE